MACTRPELIDYFTNFSGQDPIDAVICPYAQGSGGGAGMGIGLFALFTLAPMSLALGIRTSHPAPFIVTMMLSAGLIAPALPGIVTKIAALVILFAIGVAGLAIYQRAQAAL